MVLFISKFAIGLSILYDKLVVLFQILSYFRGQIIFWEKFPDDVLFFFSYSKIILVARAMKYFYSRRKVLGVTDSWTDPGGIKWDVTLCNLLAWIIVFLVLSKGIKSLGKVRILKWKCVIR